MTSAAPDLKLFDNENLRLQLESAPFRNGYYVLEFYADERGKPSAKPTGRVAVFYLYPSGGTLRDKDFNLLWYDSQYDTYRGFRPPHLRTR